jgi:outer membrane protein assembly factor BamA
MRDTSLTLLAFYEYIEDSPSISSENIDRYGVALVIGRTLTKRLSMNAGYRFTQNDSDLLGRDFTQNSFTVDFNYRF